VTTPAPEVQDRRQARLDGRDFYANQGERPPTLSPEVVGTISVGGPQAARGVDSDLSRQFGAGMAPPLRPGQARTSEATGDRRPGNGAPGQAAGKDTRGNGERGQ
jgi:hypothetical protein